MSLTLALIKIKACWEKNFPANSQYVDETKNKLYKAILDFEKRYNADSALITDNPSAVRDRKIDVTQINKNLCCIEDDCMEVISELSKLLGCETGGQTNPTTKTINATSRPGAVNIRPTKVGTYT